MGWRAQQNREDDEARERRKLPLRERYDWGALAMLVAMVVAAIAVVLLLPRRPG